MGLKNFWPIWHFFLMRDHCAAEFHQYRLQWKLQEERKAEQGGYWSKMAILRLSAANPSSSPPRAVLGYIFTWPFIIKNSPRTVSDSTP